MIPRYRYRLEALDDQTLRLHNTGKFDDGA